MSAVIFPVDGIPADAPLFQKSFSEFLLVRAGRMAYYK
jgi:hypothetical protein